MSIPTFFRGDMPDLWISLSATDVLGLIGGTSLVQDAHGVGGQVTLRNVSSLAEVPVPVVAWGSSGRDLGGRVSLGLLVAGGYEIVGQVMSMAGSLLDLGLEFQLVDGPAPLNGTVVLPASGALAGAVLRPGTSVGFVPPGPAVVTFTPPTTSLEF